jgi:hypothetical protein
MIQKGRVFMMTNKTVHVSSIFFFIATLLAASLVGCEFLDDILDGNSDSQEATGKIVLHQTGGFAGVSKMTTIEAKDGVVRLHTFDGSTETSAIEISADAFERLWETLEANDVFTLSSNTELLDTVADGFSYEVTVERGEKQNNFVVYAPEILAEQTGEKRYAEIVMAIQKLAEAGEFFIDDLPVTNVTAQIMESFPVQAAIVVEGYLRDSCTTLHEITQRREGNTVYVHITTKRPKDAICAQVITEIQEYIKLDGVFPPGNYKVIVNGVEKEFQV